MAQRNKIYNKMSDKEWSHNVYQAAKGVIEEMLSTRGIPMPFADICDAVRQRHPLLCDDTIKDPKNLKWPYWKHLVASAIQGLKKEEKVRLSDRGWEWVSEKLPPPPPPPSDEITKLVQGIKDLAERLGQLVRGAKPSPPLSHDDIIQKLKEIGETLGKKVEVKSGPVYKHDCCWKPTPYANPELVWEACDKGVPEKDIISLTWAVDNWRAKGVLVLFDEADFKKAQERFSHLRRQVYLIKVDDVISLYSLIKGGNIDVLKTILGI